MADWPAEVTAEVVYSVTALAWESQHVERPQDSQPDSSLPGVNQKKRLVELILNLTEGFETMVILTCSLAVRGTAGV